MTKTNYNRNRSVLITVWVVLFAIVPFLSGCVFDEQYPEDTGGEYVTMNMATRAFGTGDATVNRIHVLVFDERVSGRCEYNELVVTDGATFAIGKIKTGTYTFCFVANPSDDLSKRLGGISYYTDFVAVSVGRNELAPADGSYLMYGGQQTVRVTSDGNGEKGFVTYDDGTTVHQKASVLGITLYRLATKMNIAIKTKTAVTVTNPRLTGLPTTVPLLPMADVQDVKGTDIALTQKSYNPDTYTTVYEEVVIPSYLFTPIDNKGKAARLTASFDGVERSAPLKHSPAQLADGTMDNTTDYTLHRNTQYNVTANLTDIMVINVSVTDWNVQTVDLPMGIALLPEIYLSSISPLYLKKAGYLKIDGELFSADDVVLEVTDNPNNWVTLEKTTDDWKLTQVNENSIIGGGDYTDYSTLVAPDKQVTLKIKTKKHGAVFQTATVYLNRVKLAGTVWIDRCIGQPYPTAVRKNGIRYFNRNGKTGRNLGYPGANASYWQEINIPCPEGYTLPIRTQAQALIDLKPNLYMSGTGDNRLHYVEDIETGVKLVYPLSGYYKPTNSLDTGVGSHYEWGKGTNIDYFAFRPNGSLPFININDHSSGMTNTFPVRCVKK